MQYLQAVKKNLWFNAKAAFLCYALQYAATFVLKKINAPEFVEYVRLQVVTASDLSINNWVPFQRK